jgi:hypothetical protein
MSVELEVRQGKHLVNGLRAGAPAAAVARLVAEEAV